MNVEYPHQKIKEMEGGRKKRSKYAGRGRQNTVCFYSKVVPDLLLKRDTEYNECRADIFLSDCQKRDFG